MLWWRRTVPTSVNDSPVCVRLLSIFATDTVHCHRIPVLCASVYWTHCALPFEECCEYEYTCIYCKFDVILTVHRRQYVEIKCQLDATEVFIADLIACSTCFGHHCAHRQELKSIIKRLLRVVFRAVVFQVAGLVWSWGLCVRFAGCCSILQTEHITLSWWA